MVRIRVLGTPVSINFLRRRWHALSSSRSAHGGGGAWEDGSATAAIHADAEPRGGVSPDLGLSTTFSLAPGDDAAGIEADHIYSRISNPTRDRCEALLGAVEGVRDAPAHAVLYSSGLAATFAALVRLLPKRVAISGGYHATHHVLEQLSRIAGGTAYEVVALPAPEDAARDLRPGDVVWLETPLNPTLDVHDIAAYAEVAKAVGDVRVVVDGTFAPPPLQRPLLLGADIVMHSTTKSLAGHSDAIGGALCVADPTLATELREERTNLGSTPGQLEVWLLMRSLRTLHLRVDRQSRTATRLAAWLEAATPGGGGGEGGVGGVPDPHPLAGLVHAVHHPSLPSHAGHAVAKRQMTGGYGGCFAVELATECAARELPAALELFRDATSLGGVEGLAEWRRKYDDEVSPLLVRISVGLEEPEDLEADLERAILATAATSEN